MVFGQYLAACLTLTVASFSTPDSSLFVVPDSSLGTVAAFTEPNGSNATAMQLKVTMQPVLLSIEDEILEFLEQQCGQHFNATMSEIGSDQWCNWAAVASFYSTLTNCTEAYLLLLKHFWPNEVGERFFVNKHNDYFRWCHGEPGELLADPANNMLLGLVLTPICIIPLMVGLVVWCSKTSDTKK